MAGDLGIRLGKVPFQEAIDYFQAKQPLPTDAYTDMVHAMHDRAFVVAGVTRQDILTDVQQLVGKALAEGTPLKDFQAAFEQAIAGKWEPKQGTAWRARVIYETNVRTAYAAGRYKQLVSMKDTHPFWRYKHGDSRRPRMVHLGWDGMILAWDDPWWKSNYPPNGWGCRCSVVAQDDVDMEALGKTGPDDAPPTNSREVKFGDGTIMVPRGVDPGWGYAPGENWSTWPARSPEGARPGEGGAAAGSKHLTAGNWETQGRPEIIPVDQVKGKLLLPAKDAAGVVARLEDVLGGPQKVFRIQAGGLDIPMVVDAQALGGHLPLDRSRFLGLLPGLLEDPFEVWAGFTEDASGRVRLKYRMVKSVEVAGKSLLMVAEGNGKGLLEAVTVIPMNKPQGLNPARWGRLIYGRTP